MAMNKRIRNIQQPRILDMTQKYNEVLSIINECEQMPLIPLDIDVESLVPFLSSIETHANEALQQCHDPPADRLTIAQLASIRLYSMDKEFDDTCFCVELSTILRSSDKQNC